METSVNNKYKAFTSLEQSRRLAEILPIESADMGWNVFVDDTTRILPIDDWDLVKDGSGNVEFYYAWSLAALLEVLPEYNLQRTDWGNKTEYKIVVTTDEDNYASKNYDNPLDACYEMIIKLHELNLL